MIWFKEVTVQELNEMSKNTMLEHLDIRIEQIGDGFISASMPVDCRTVQPAGFLHGGASVTLAESLGSIAGTLCINAQKQICVGVEINANHLRSVTSGRVTGVTKPLHIGKRMQVWETKINNDKNKLVCVSRLTLAVVEKR